MPSKHTLDEIERNARCLMATLGRAYTGRTLQALGWTFRFDRARKRLGCCRWRPEGRRKHVSLSRHYAGQLGWAGMEDVVRHEIAHALDYETRGRSDHGAAWKRWARRCGADPARLYEGETLRDATSRYVGVCPACGRETPFYRRLKRPHACSDCCRAHNGGRYADAFRLVLVERATGRAVAVPARTARRRG